MTSTIQIQPAARGGITVLDCIEHYGLTYHIGSAVELLVAACRTHPVDMRKVEKAKALLKRFIDDPHNCNLLPEAAPGALKWRTPQNIIAALGLKGVPAVAVTYLLNASAFTKNRDCEVEIGKALAALERMETT